MKLVRLQNARQPLLVVDDQELIRESLEHILTHAGFCVRLASGCADGESALVNLTPAVLICDVRLADGCGSRLISLARELEIPCIAITGEACRSELIRAVNSGVVRVLEKPFSPEALLSAVEVALSTRCPAALLRRALKRMP